MKLGTIWTPADDLRNSLKGLLHYRALFDSIWPGAYQNAVVRQSLREMGDFLDNASDREIIEGGPELYQILSSMVSKAKEALPPKVSDAQILADFSFLRGTNAFSFTHGIQFHWLNKWFDCMELPIPKHFPAHGIVGVGQHSGMFIVEEQHLLSDAFYLKAKVEQLWNGLEESMIRGKVSDDAFHKYRDIASHINTRLCCFARLCVFSFYSFVECFVNSVAEDYRLTHSELDAETQDLLKGLKKGRIANIEYKLEKLPQLIRGDGSTPILISDPKQRKDPFINFVGRLKELRGSTAHFAKHKAAIWMRPQEWVIEVDNASETCMAVAREFWTACFPSREQPDYLHGLNEEKLHQEAEETLQDEIEARDVLDLCVL